MRLMQITVLWARGGADIFFASDEALTQLYEEGDAEVYMAQAFDSAERPGEKEYLPTPLVAYFSMLAVKFIIKNHNVVYEVNTTNGMFLIAVSSKEKS